MRNVTEAGDLDKASDSVKRETRLTYKIFKHGCDDERGGDKIETAAHGVRTTY